MRARAWLAVFAAGLFFAAPGDGVAENAANPQAAKPAPASGQKVIKEANEYARLSRRLRGQ